MNAEQLEGRNPCLEALQADLPVTRVLLAKGSQGESMATISRLCKERGIPIEWVTRQELDNISRTGRHQGVIAQTEAFQYASFQDLLDLRDSKGDDFLLVILAGIQDPQNLGSIIRTAEVAGAQGVVIPRHRAAGLTPAVSRASAGALAHLPVAQVTNLVQCVKALQERGVWVVGADMAGEQTHYDANLKGPLALVLGSEGKGMGPLLAKHCDALVRLPMYGKISSLNVSVATGILLYEVLRQRLKAE